MKTVTEKKFFTQSPSAHKTKKRITVNVSVFLIITTATLTLYAVISPKIAINTTLETLKNFAEKVLPSTFLFSVATSMLVKSGFGEVCKKAVSKPFEKFFAMNGSLSAALILGAVGGFPLGAKTVSELYKDGNCTKEEAERALPLCSNPGIGFTVVGVGETLLGSNVTGIKLWLSCLLSSIAVSILKSRKYTVRSRNLPHLTTKPPHTNTPQRTATETVIESVSESAASMLKVCGFVVIFKTVSAVFLEITASSPLFHQVSSPFFSALITCIFEFSSGIFNLTQAVSDQLTVCLPFTSPVPLLHLLTATTLAWSGISVHMQTTAFASSNNLTLKNYYPQKLLSAVLTPLCFILLTYVETAMKHCKFF